MFETAGDEIRLSGIRRRGRLRLQLPNLSREFFGRSVVGSPGNHAYAFATRTMPTRPRMPDARTEAEIDP